MAYLLGIDIGTSGTKALICNARGKVLATASAPHTRQEPKAGFSEQSPAQWWSAVQKATGAVVKKAKIRGDQVAGVGLSGQMHGSVFLGEGTTPLRPAILWNDQRTAAECEAITKAAGGKKKLIKMVGNPALTGFTAPKILWVRKHEKQVWKQTRHVLLPKDYIRLCMTGDYATEVSDASGLLLLDVKKRKYNQKLLDFLKLKRELFPDCVESHEVTGTLHKAGAKALGLKEGTPVVGGAGDNAAGAVGNGIVSRGLVNASLGTSGVVYAHADEPVYDPAGRVHTMCSAIDGKWCVFGCMLSAAGSFQWYRDQLRPGEDFSDLVKEAKKASAGSDGLCFLPYLTGERCPHPDPEARGAFIGLTTRHGKKEMTRALLEGITYGMAEQTRIFTEMGLPMKTIRLTGGGAQSAFWRQLQADVYGKPVATVNSAEGPAFGVAILAGVGTGVWKSVPAACKQMVKETKTLKPDPAAKKAYARRVDTYQSLYPALKDVFPALA